MISKISFAICAVMFVCTMSFAEAIPPVPAPLTGDRSLFIGNAGGDTVDRPNKFANEVFAATLDTLRNGPYHLAKEPYEADLLAEVSVGTRFSSVSSGLSFPQTFIRLRIFDKASHALLWTLDEEVNNDLAPIGRSRNLGKAMLKLAADVNTLASGRPPQN